MVDNLKKTTSENLENSRKKLGLNHSEFAEKLGVNRTTLYLYESGRRNIPIELLYRLWEVFKIEPNEILGIVKD